jgi:two-component system LytT family response regulator
MDPKMTAIIVDDEKKGRELLQVLLSAHCPGIRVIGQAGSAAEAFDIISNLRPDIVFLDIEMPGGSGFDLLQKFDTVRFSVVFVTAYDKYAIKAFKFSAADYLLKPVDEEELVKAVEKIACRKENEIGPTVESATHNYKNLQRENNRLALSTSEGLVFIEIPDITRCKADGKYTWIYLNNKKPILATKNLGEFEEFLKEHNFIRIHHSHLVNLAFVLAYQNGRSGLITMNDGTELEVSQRKKEGFMKRLHKI